ncbi:hypothetical protein HMPREF1487_09461 [Pseudomonas sp. HPB0071]|uniref:Uncharacterized protein n=1 Tax=Pseudomonas luteola TaxID=47886 RepID=A0A2X2BW94_PSELU|nr:MULTISPECIES: hypothetical protein [Pseudomonas]ENA26982.1 hypothetical protein HMPREF1487_09461 [Pseudomonas sp. HPB0071]MBA1250190.1 hypothetical protein [Pseudomonas zeshuii]MBH3440941.1 hypothetical protein [Pseudomonas luteola]SPY99957.1 Uncharacterised protein [Pseudomonas luteola]
MPQRDRPDTEIVPAADPPNTHPPKQRTAEPETKATEEKRLFDKTRKTFRFLLAIDAWKRQGQILAHRASFPLLRRVLAVERKNSRAIFQLDSIPINLLEKSKVGHLIIMAFMGPAFIWALITLTKGIAALVRYHVPFNTWLFYGVPLAIYTGFRLRSSFLAYNLFSEEISKRNTGKTCVSEGLKE